MLSRLLDALGFQSYVKLPGKTLATLAPSDVALMIECFITGDEASFDKSAIYEFISLRHVDPFLQSAKSLIEDIHIRNRSEHCPDGLMTRNGLNELRQLAERWR